MGVGCLLLFLNVLIFAGIYYQRGKEFQRKNKSEEHLGSNGSAETLSAAQQNCVRDGLLNKSSDINMKAEIKAVPPFTTIPGSFEMDFSTSNNVKKDNQAVLLRTTNNSCGTSIKKRVQIQEISV